MPSLLHRLRLALSFLAAVLFAAEVLATGPTPPKPTHYFNDYAGLVTPAQAEGVDAKLRRFAEETGTQILVAVIPALPEGEVVEDFTVRTAQAWRAGEKKLDNGAVLFVFVKDRKLRIEVGYGLEGALPDALARRIIDEAIVPGFRAGNPAAGLEAGVDAMMAATRGEYTAKPKPAGGGGIPPIVIIIIILIVISFLSSRGGGGGMRGPSARTYSRRGSMPWIFTGGGGWGGGGGSWGGGGGGGGGFSGGGGSFGGGGASGSW